ncbi:MAG: hypothetical protein ACXVIG_05715 [Halobacteriota archaeon]
MAKLTVGQCREALHSDKPCIEVKSSQDKSKCSLCAASSTSNPSDSATLGGKKDGEPVFEYVSLLQWVKREKIPLMRVPSHFRLGILGSLPSSTVM